jgi:hypothetical protein
MIPLRDSNGDALEDDDGKPITINPAGLVELVKLHLSMAKAELARAEECLNNLTNSVDMEKVPQRRK